MESSSLLKKLLHMSTETVRVLQLLAVSVNKWDQILVHIIVDKFDCEARRQCKLTIKRHELPTFAQITTFIDSRWQALELVTNQPSMKTNHIAPRKPHTIKSFVLHSTATHSVQQIQLFIHQLLSPLKVKLKYTQRINSITKPLL